MADITAAQLFSALQQLEERLNARIDGSHARLRDTVDRAVTTLSDKLDAHAKDDEAVATRVTVLETVSAEEEKQAIKRGAWAGIFAAFGLTAAWELLKMLGHK